MNIVYEIQFISKLSFKKEINSISFNVMKSYLKGWIILEMKSSIILQYFNLFFLYCYIKNLLQTPLAKELIMAFSLQVTAGPPKNQLLLLLIACRPMRFRL